MYIQASEALNYVKKNVPLLINIFQIKYSLQKFAVVGYRAPTYMYTYLVQKY